MFTTAVILVTTLFFLGAESKGIFNNAAAPAGQYRDNIVNGLNLPNKPPISTIKKVRAGQVGLDVEKSEKWSLSQTLFKNILGLWGVLQVVSILANAIKRLVPIALQPFIQKDMHPYQWAMYVTWCIFMVYNEGYKAFQLKFSPLVVNRAFGISKNPSVLKYIFAGPYSMGLFGADRKRMIISWSITAGVFSLVKLVKMLPYPYRSIADSGVVAGLSYGTLSIIFLTVRALLGKEVGNGDQGLPAPPQSKTQ
jgi:hypothetical protein